MLVSSNEFISGIYKELLHINKKKTKKPNKNEQIP